VSFQSYPKYKSSGVEWLGDVPEPWSLAPIWTFFRRVKRVNAPNEELLSVYRDYGVVPKTARDDNFNKPSDDLSTYQLVMPGDLVINKMKAWQGSVAISAYRGIVSPAYFVYTPLHRENPRYLHYLFRSLRYITGYLSISKGIRPNQWDLEPEQHSRLLVVVPSLQEQDAIAGFLDRETAKIDELVAEQEKLILLLKEKRQAVISHAVTKGLNPHVPMKESGIEWLGQIPAHWNVCRAKFLVANKNGIQMGPFGGMLLDLSATDTGFKVYGQENTISGDFERGTRWIDEGRFHELSNYQLSIGDIVLTRKGSLGNARLIERLPSPGIIDSDTIRLRTSGDVVLSEFLVRVLHEADYISVQFAISKRGAILSGVNSETIANLWAVIPPLNEQTEVLAQLRRVDAEIREQAVACEEVMRLLQERRSALISAAVTGQIDVRRSVEGHTA
jgi:type I restriction enzyme S subunit